MPQQSDRFQLLAHQFESLVERLNESTTPSLEERTKVLRQMKVVIVEIEMLIMSDLKLCSENAPSSHPPAQPAAGEYS
jgi:hypothetical protein